MLRCPFCSSTEDLKPCAWPVEREGWIYPEKLDVGDTVIWPYCGKQLVIGLARFIYEDGRAIIQLGFNPRNPADRKRDFYPIVRALYGPFLRGMVRGVCRSLCCELHRREVSDTKCYCMSHWSAWEPLWGGEVGRLAGRSAVEAC